MVFYLLIFTDAIYDITLGYPKTLPQRGELDLIMGNFPEEVRAQSLANALYWSLLFYLYSSSISLIKE